MDDPVYAQNAVRKIQAYEENGIYPGERLILTFETGKIVLDTRTIERTCLQIFTVEYRSPQKAAEHPKDYRRSKCVPCVEAIPRTGGMPCSVCGLAS